MLQNTTDRANIDDDIANVAKLIGKSKPRRAVFKAIYHGKKKWKKIGEIAKQLNMTPKRVSMEAIRFVSHKYINQDRIDGETAYSKDSILNQHKKQILAAAGSKAKLAKLPTRSRPHIAGGSKSITVKVGKSNPVPKMITVDDVESFRKVRKIRKVDPALKLSKVLEDRTKQGFKRILGETHDFKDWGGEKNDLYTTQFRLKSRRVAAAFAFKGRATQGTLTPKKMGTSGDQIGRLVSSDAAVFFVVYHGKVDESVYAQLRVYALGRSMQGTRVYYGVIDGDDLNRLWQAYRGHFDRK